MNDPTKTTYGEMAPGAPPELRMFSFLIGKFEGVGKTRLGDGTLAEFPVTNIGRYILDGMAIADELHAPAPDGSPYLGITLLQFDAARRGWIVEFLNVTGSFLRRQVNAAAGKVTVDGRDVTVHSASPGITIREHYLVLDSEHFTYRLDVSTDDGQTWNEGQMEMNFSRVGE